MFVCAAAAAAAATPLRLFYFAAIDAHLQCSTKFFFFNEYVLHILILFCAYFNLGSS